MGLIKKSNEIAIQRNVKMMVYGQAGMGKTTLALSAPKPLLLDFDNLRRKQIWLRSRPSWLTPSAR